MIQGSIRIRALEPADEEDIGLVARRMGETLDEVLGRGDSLSPMPKHFVRLSKELVTSS